MRPMMDIPSQVRHNPSVSVTRRRREDLTGKIGHMGEGVNPASPTTVSGLQSESSEVRSNLRRQQARGEVSNLAAFMSDGVVAHPETTTRRVVNPPSSSMTVLPGPGDRAPVAAAAAGTSEPPRSISPIRQRLEKRHREPDIKIGGGGLGREQQFESAPRFRSPPRHSRLDGPATVDPQHIAASSVIASMGPDSASLEAPPAQPSDDFGRIYNGSGGNQNDSIGASSSGPATYHHPRQDVQATEPTHLRPPAGNHPPASRQLPASSAAALSPPDQKSVQALTDLFDLVYRNHAEASKSYLDFRPS